MSIRAETPSVAVLAPGLRETLLQWSRAHSPREACGYLLGRRTEARTEILDVVQGENVALGNDAFELDPGDVVKAALAAAPRDLELVGFWHSHPRGSATPSATDQHDAWADHLCVIVSLCATPDIRAWRVAEGRLDECLLDEGAACADEVPAHNRRSTSLDPDRTP